MNGGSGRCLCAAVRFAFEGAPNWQGHCHCESCRRATASPFTSFLGVGHAGFRWLGAAPARRESSPGVWRFYCGACGTPMAYQSPVRTQEIDLYAATLDDPAAFRPAFHAHWNERLPWVELADGLPRHRTPRRLSPDEDAGAVLALIRRSFAFMDARIDPPSSMHRLTTEAIARQARDGEVWVIEETGAPVACVFLTPKPGRLYIGKLAVDEAFRRQGLSRQLVALAEDRARALGLGLLELEVRIELTENHRMFEGMGFARSAETSHEGYDRITGITFTRPVARPGAG